MGASVALGIDLVVSPNKSLFLKVGFYCSLLTKEKLFKSEEIRF